MLKKGILDTGRFGLLIMLILSIIFTNPNLLLAQNITSIKSVINKTDTLGDITHVFTKHGDFIINDYDIDVKRKWSENKKKQFYSAIDESENKWKSILIQYNKNREILDVNLVK
jgi:hypothetical protein